MVVSAKKQKYKAELVYYSLNSVCTNLNNKNSLLLGLFLKIT